MTQGYIDNRKSGVTENSVIESVNTTVIWPTVGQGIQHTIDGLRIFYPKTSSYTAHEYSPSFKIIISELRLGCLERLEYLDGMEAICTKGIGAYFLSIIIRDGSAPNQNLDLISETVLLQGFDDDPHF